MKQDMYCTFAETNRSASGTANEIQNQGRSQNFQSGEHCMWKLTIMIAEESK